MKPRSGDADEYDYTYAESALGWGGMIVGPDGIGEPMPDAEALAFAIPLWVDVPEHIENAVSIYLDVMSRPEAAIRKAAITAIGAVVHRYGHLPHEALARQTVREALADSSAEVSAAAAATSEIIRNVLG
jgi:hypothetical protein